MDDWYETMEAFCAVCKKLHEDNTPKVYKDMKQWFVTQGRCKRVRSTPLRPLRALNAMFGKFDILLKEKSFEDILQV